jgi:transcriptional regulator with XRE-family HTH domain
MKKFLLFYLFTDETIGGLYMDTREAVSNRIKQLCRERNITPNAISNIAGVPQATVKSILNGESKNPGIVTIKKLCDGFEITLSNFFSTQEFDELEQEIK